jgi:hypothetical protein
LLLAAGTVKCGGERQPGTSSEFRLGAYDNCSTATLLKVPGGGGEQGLAGSLTLGQSGSVLTVSYGGDGGIFDASFRFTQASATSATLLPGQAVSGVVVPCAPMEFTPSVAKLESGSLTYNAGTLFLSVEGADEPVDAGGGCSNPGGRASVLITCSEDAGAIGAGSGAASLGSDFVGVYTCVSSTVSFESTDAGSYESASSNNLGALGTLTITETGGVLTAAYTNDGFVSGSLQFVATTHNAAVPATANETMQVECSNPRATSGNGISVSSLPVTSSTLTIDGSSVVLSFTGNFTSNSSCPGAETFVNLLCSK